jgi:hypothetical protein
MRISARKRLLTFETDDVVFDRGKSRPVVVTAKPKVAEMKLKGSRMTATVCVPWSAIYMRGLAASQAGS